jgi:molybdenum cofactor cytidylyltransferase
MISAIVLAAGKSMRMGRQKMLLPWKDTTVLGQVIRTVQNAGVADVLVVTGHMKPAIDQITAHLNVRVVHNENFETGEMLGSIQCGLKTLPAQAEAALICLGDQPQIQEVSIRSVCEAFHKTGASLVVPSYQMRRGHPWLVARPLWSAVFDLGVDQTPRDFLKMHAADIAYVEMDSPSIIEDLDTPEDYLKFKPSV